MENIIETIKHLDQLKAFGRVYFLGQMFYASILELQLRTKCGGGVGKTIYPVGEVHGGGSSLSSLHFHFHLAPERFHMITRANLTHHAGQDKRKKI